MNRDNKGRFSKTKDGDDFPDEEPEKQRFLDRPPSIKLLLLFLLMTWLSTFIFPHLKDETTRRMQSHLCGYGAYSNNSNHSSHSSGFETSSTRSNKEK